jgi:hypothetical protein
LLPLIAAADCCRWLLPLVAAADCSEEAARQSSEQTRTSHTVTSLVDSEHVTELNTTD